MYVGAVSMEFSEFYLLGCSSHVIQAISIGPHNNIGAQAVVKFPEKHVYFKKLQTVEEGKKSRKLS